MKALIVTCFRNGPEGQRLKNELVQLTKKHLREYSVDTNLEVVVTGLYGVKDYVSTEERSDPAVTRFDAVDIIIIDGDPSLLPWQPQAKLVWQFLVQCYTTGKSIFAGTFGAQALAHIITLGGQPVSVFNGGGEGSSLDRLSTIDTSSSLAAYKKGQLFLDDSTGDLYSYNPECRQWSLQSNVGLRKFRCDPLTSGSRGTAAVQRSLIERRTSHFFKSTSSGAGVVGPMALHPRAYVVHPKTEQRKHWLLEDVSLPHAMSTGADAGKGAFEVNGAMRRWDINVRGCADMFQNDQSTSKNTCKNDTRAKSTVSQQVDKNTTTLRSSKGKTGDAMTSQTYTASCYRGKPPSSRLKGRPPPLPVNEHSMKKYVMRGPVGSIRILAVGDRGVDLFEFGHSIGAMFHVDSRYPSTVRILRNFIKSKLALIRRVGRLEYTTQREYLERLNSGELGPPPPPNDKYSFRFRSPHPPPPHTISSPASLSTTLGSSLEAVLLESRPTSAKSLNSGTSRPASAASRDKRSDNVQASVLELLRRIPGGLDPLQRKLLSEMLLGERMQSEDWMDVLGKEAMSSTQGNKANVEVAYRIMREIEEITGGGAVGRQFRADFVDIMKGVGSQFWVDNDPKRSLRTSYKNRPQSGKPSIGSRKNDTTNNSDSYREEVVSQRATLVRPFSAPSRGFGKSLTRPQSAHPLSTTVANSAGGKRLLSARADTKRTSTSRIGTVAIPSSRRAESRDGKMQLEPEEYDEEDALDDNYSEISSLEDIDGGLISIELSHLNKQRRKGAATLSNLANERRNSRDAHAPELPPSRYPYPENPIAATESEVCDNGSDAFYVGKDDREAVVDVLAAESSLLRSEQGAMRESSHASSHGYTSRVMGSERQPYESTPRSPQRTVHLITKKPRPYSAWKRFRAMGIR